jgi:hypothetical protein
MHQTELLRSLDPLFSFLFRNTPGCFDFHRGGGESPQKQALVFYRSAATSPVYFLYLTANTLGDSDFVVVGLVDEVGDNLGRKYL